MEVYRENYPSGNPKVQYEHINGVKNGEYKFWARNLWTHCYFKDGKLDGERKTYWKSRLLTQYQYKNGNRHGECKEWHENGKLYIHCWFQNNRLHGEYKIWDEQGNIIDHEHYENDEQILKVPN